MGLSEGREPARADFTLTALGILLALAPIVSFATTAPLHLSFGVSGVCCLGVLADALFVNPP
jgi:hypothetical protein